MKGGFGGGFAIIGIPLLALVMDPLTAGALLAPLFILMDAVALRYWKPSTWSVPDLKLLLPGLVVGVAAGSLLLSVLDTRLVSILLASVTLGFTAQWYLAGGAVTTRERSTLGALAAGAASGITTMAAHSGGPPLALYLLRLGLPKAIYAGTTSLFFTLGNLIKAGPWLAIGGTGRELWLLMLILSPAVPLGVWAGWCLHNRLDQRQMYVLCYALLVVTSTKLLFDGIMGYVE